MFPSGITHDARHLDPYGIYIARAHGPHKWDVDGNRYVDYFGGHGALLLGHRHPVVIEAVHAGARRAARSSAPATRARSPGRARSRSWSRPPRRVRFTSSGTEATLMARAARARVHRARDAACASSGHFHGWHDHMAFGYTNHFDGTPTPGVLGGVAQKSVLLRSRRRRAACEAALDDQHRHRRRDHRADRLELRPGADRAGVPARAAPAHRGTWRAADLRRGGHRLPRRRRAARRWRSASRPDLTSFAKIVAGGLPGGAVAGRKDILDLLDFQRARRQRARRRSSIPARSTPTRFRPPPAPPRSG